MKTYIAENIKDFNPVHIFECGQCFRWNQSEDGKYIGTAKEKAVRISFLDKKVSEDSREPGGAPPEILEGKADLGGTLVIENADESDFNNIWREYFDLGRDYGKIKDKLSIDDEKMQAAVAHGYGIRILNQDLWETIISFIISQNNNIPRIKGCIERLCECFGEKVENPFCESAYSHGIPSAEKLASLNVDDLAPIRLGYRAKYIIDTARSVCENGLPSNYNELLTLNGVGPKVANCIELFGLHNMSSFPIDVWVKRLMHELYGIPEEDKKAMMHFAEKNFGEYRGIAQQYLFYYMREKA